MACSRPSFEGFQTVRHAPDGRTIGMCRLGQHTVLAELCRGGGLRPIAAVPQGLAANLEENASVRYAVSHFQRGSQAVGNQTIWEVPYDAGGNWTFPGHPVASFAAASDTLTCRSSGVHATYPKTSTGGFVVFDGGTGRNESYNHAPNQGYHLGVVRPPFPPATIRPTSCRLSPGRPAQGANGPSARRPECWTGSM